MTAVHWLLTNGIGQGLVDTAIVTLITAPIARFKVLPEWRRHRRQIHELHQAIVKNRSTE